MIMNVSLHSYKQLQWNDDNNSNNNNDDDDDADADAASWSFRQPVLRFLLALSLEKTTP